VTHFATPAFWAAYHELPDAARALADKNFALLKSDPRHPSLRFKRVGPYWSVRIGLRYRALAKERSERLVWFWIGTHDRYDELVAS